MNHKKIKIYLEMARSVAKNSKDEETQVGAILISENGSVVATGYNGFLRGAKDSILPKTRPHKHLFMQHAERNLLYNCLYEGISSKNSTVICTLSPCMDCLRALFQSGVKKVIYETLYHKINENDYVDAPDLNVDFRQEEGYTVLTLDDLRSVSEEEVRKRLTKIIG